MRIGGVKLAEADRTQPGPGVPASRMNIGNSGHSFGEAEHRVDHGLSSVPVRLLALERDRDLRREAFSQRRPDTPPKSASLLGK